MPENPIGPSLTVAQGADLLAHGRLVAFPTETVYGLGARADDDRAVAAIFQAKGRPADHPLIVHVLDEQGAQDFAAELPPVALRLMKAFWPGPLTVIVPRRPGVATASAGGQDSIGLRCPSHPVARELLWLARERGVSGVAAPSANRFGRVSPTTAQHVRDEFGDAVAVLDGGACAVGIESAIVDCTRSVPVLLRPGTIGAAAIESAAGQRLGLVRADSPRASGTLESHYAPLARVRTVPLQEIGSRLQALLQRPGPAPQCVALYSTTGLDCSGAAPVVWRPMPQTPEELARDLFAALRDLDAAVQSRGGGEIWVQAIPEGAAWDGVRDRLVRACA